MRPILLNTRKNLPIKVLENKKLKVELKNEHDSTL